MRCGAFHGYNAGIYEACSGHNNPGTMRSAELASPYVLPTGQESFPLGRILGGRHIVRFGCGKFGLKCFLFAPLFAYNKRLPLSKAGVSLLDLYRTRAKVSMCLSGFIEVCPQAISRNSPPWL